MVTKQVVLSVCVVAVAFGLAGNRSCVPIDPEEPVCVYGPGEYAAGESFPALDGCNTCTCEADGAVSCTDFPCGPDAPGVYLMIDQVLWPEGARVQPTWWNHTDEAIFLPGCTTFSVEELDEDSGEWVDLGPPAVCVWEGYAVKVEPWESHTDFVDAWALGVRRLRGEYWRGCLDGEPLSQAQCAEGPFAVYSQLFESYPSPESAAP